MPPTTHTSDRGHYLATAVSWNAVFSGVSGTVLLLGAPLLDGPLEVHGALLAAVGAGLVGFSAVLLWLLAGPHRLRTGTPWVIAADLVWIGCTVALLLVWPDAVSDVGRISLAAVSAVVAGLAVGQMAGLRRHGAGPTDATSPVSLRFERTLPVPADRVWDAVADAGGYAEFAPGIAATEIVAGNGPGMVRACTDDHGGTWSETCTIWEDGHRYRMTVDVSSYPTYYRMLLHEFAQTWTVTPAGSRTRLTLEFDGRAKLGVLGRLAVRLLGNGRRLEAILDNYERDLVARHPASP